ncbi:hypothetical protein F110043I8_02030 [Ruminococcus sp. f11]
MVHVANDSKKLLFIFEMTQDGYRKAAIEADTQMHAHQETRKMQA